MVEVLCRCGSVQIFEAPAVGESLDCPKCRGRARLVAGEPIDPASAAGDFDARLIIEAGPAHVGQTIAVGGIPDIGLGKSAERHIPLDGHSVSRAHARLVRLDFGPSRWKVADTASRNGVFVNGRRVAETELSDGDLIQIGEFALRYRVGLPPPPPVAAPGAHDPAMPGINCPGCGVQYRPANKICTTCGVDLKTGRPLVTAKGFDEDQMAETTDTAIKVVSFLIWLGLFPIASEAFATHKPKATWWITGITFVVSLIFLIGTWCGQGPWPQSMKNLMLWTGSRSMTVDDLDNLKDLPDFKNLSDDEKQMINQLLAKQSGDDGEFHVYQLLTNALLHGGIMHFAGNMVFMLVFGLRVNELIGNLKMAIVYPILAVMASGILAISDLHSALHPSLGASGAIMGLAGMYFVFFPVHKVRMAAWIRMPLLLGWRLYYKIFSMKGFWLLGLWVGFNDVLPTVLSMLRGTTGPADGVAHWAHLGGFASGVLIGLGLLCARQVNARGADILSVVMGPKAWALIGKPTGRGAAV